MIYLLELIQFDNKYMDQYKEAYLLALDAANKGIIKRKNMSFKNPDEVDVVQMARDASDETKLKPGWVKAYKFMAVEDGKFIGMINVRESVTEELARYGGHIGYAVNPKYWNKGYGTKILGLVLSKYKHLIKDDKIIITCDDTNIGSAKIIEANGGILIDKVENEENGEKFLSRRYYIDK